MQSVNRLLSILLLVFITSCASKPPLDLEICDINSAQDHLACSTRQTSRIIQWNNANNYICMSPDDFEAFVRELKESK